MTNSNNISTSYLRMKKKQKAIKTIIFVLLHIVILMGIILSIRNANIREQNFFNAQNEIHTVKSYNAYLDKYGQSSTFSFQANDSIDAIERREDNALWNNLIQQGKYQEYINSTKKGLYKNEAEKKLEEQIWKQSKKQNSYQTYLDKYPYGKFASEAKEMKENALWNTESKAWNEATRIDEIYAYEKYLKLYHYGSHFSRAKKKIIDKEVDNIFGSDHGSLPSMDKTSYSYGDSYSIISIYNNTAYTLTLRYSGNDSQSISIPSRSSRSLTLQNGNYRIAASVSASNVRNFAGTENLTGGSYDVEYYIQTRRAKSDFFKMR
jgi:hypothetical protein